MINGSVWIGKLDNYPELTKDIKRKTVVVGGGIAGFLTAFRLSAAGEKVTLIEADKLFSGTTGKTTGKISCNQAVYYGLFKKYGKEQTRKYYLSQKEAQSGIIKLIEKYSVNCDLMQADSYVFTNVDGAELKADYKLLTDFGADCEWLENVPFLNARYALKMNGEFMFDVLKFVSALPKNFEIFEHTRAVEIDCAEKSVITEKAKIRAENIIVATHYPIINTHGGYILKLRQSQSYLAAFDARKVEGMYLDERKEGLTLRPYRDGIIIGGGDHRTGRSAGDKLNNIKSYAEKYIDTGDATHFWCAEDVMTADGMPMAGKYWIGGDGIYVITGFNKWGMTNSYVCADIICDAILGRENKYSALFAPDRKIKGALPFYFKNSLVTLKDVFKSYLHTTFKRAKSIPPESGRVIRYKGKKRAVYKDESGRLYVIGSKCTHMHGELYWNENNKCWECPCHGSQFDIYGNVVSSPATKTCKFFSEKSDSDETLK